MVSDPEALELVRMNSMVRGPIASILAAIPPKSARVIEMKPDAPDSVLSTTEFPASESMIWHVRTPSRVEAKLKSSEVKFVKFGAGLSDVVL
jgi:hypothetical protein